MKRGLAYLAAAFVSLGGSALAADLPTAKPAPVMPIAPPVYNWGGFYLGLNAGVGFTDSGHVTVFDPALGPYQFGLGSRTGFVGGGQAGYNIQTGAWVWGLEADIQGVATGGNSINWGRYAYLGLNNSGGDGGFLGTARARVGYAIDRTLIYATGGLAYGGWNNDPFNNNNTNIGYAVGGGVEYAFAQNWTAKVEGLYVNLSNGNHTILVPNGGVNYPVTFNNNGGGGLVRVGVNYKF
jgi:outer membrane immunogenic protein